MQQNLQKIVYLAQEQRQSIKLSFIDLCQAFDKISSALPQETSRKLYKRLIQQSVRDQNFYLRFSSSIKSKTQSARQSPKSMSKSASNKSFSWGLYSQSKQPSIYRSIRKRMDKLNQPRRLRKNLWRQIQCSVDQTAPILLTPQSKKLDMLEQRVQDELLYIKGIQCRHRYKMLMNQKQKRTLSRSIKILQNNCNKMRQFKLKVRLRNLKFYFQGFKLSRLFRKKRLQTQFKIKKKCRIRIISSYFNFIKNCVAERKNVLLRFPLYYKKKFKLVIHKFFTFWKNGIGKNIIVGPHTQKTKNLISKRRLKVALKSIYSNYINKKIFKKKKNSLNKYLKIQSMKFFFYRLFIFLQKIVNSTQLKLIGQKFYFRSLVNKSMIALKTIKMRQEQIYRSASQYFQIKSLKLIFQILKFQKEFDQQSIIKIKQHHNSQKIKELLQLLSPQVVKQRQQQIARNFFKILKTQIKQFGFFIKKIKIFSQKKVFTNLFLINKSNKMIKMQKLELNKMKEIRLNLLFERFKQKKYNRCKIVQKINKIKNLIKIQTLQNLKQSINQKVKNKKQLNQKQMKLYIQLLLPLKEKYSKALLSKLLQRVKRKIILDKIDSNFNISLTNKYFNILRGYFYLCKQRQFQLKKKLNIHSTQSELDLSQIKINQMAYAFRHAVLLTNIFTRWLSYTKSHKNSRLLVSKLKQSFNLKLLSQCFRQWKTINYLIKQKINSLFQIIGQQLLLSKQQAIYQIQHSSLQRLLNKSLILICKKKIQSSFLIIKEIWQQYTSKRNLLQHGIPYYGLRHKLRIFKKNVRLGLSRRMNNQQIFINLLEKAKTHLLMEMCSLIKRTTLFKIKTSNLFKRIGLKKGWNRLKQFDLRHRNINLLANMINQLLFQVNSRICSSLILLFIRARDLTIFQQQKYDKIQTILKFKRFFTRLKKTNYFIKRKKVQTEYILKLKKIIFLKKLDKVSKFRLSAKKISDYGVRRLKIEFIRNLFKLYKLRKKIYKLQKKTIKNFFQKIKSHWNSTKTVRGLLKIVNYFQRIARQSMLIVLKSLIKSSMISKQFKSYIQRTVIQLRQIQLHRLKSIQIKQIQLVQKRFQKYSRLFLVRTKAVARSISIFNKNLQMQSVISHRKKQSLSRKIFKIFNLVFIEKIIAKQNLKKLAVSYIELNQSHIFKPVIIARKENLIILNRLKLCLNKLTSRSKISKRNKQNDLKTAKIANMIIHNYRKSFLLKAKSNRLLNTLNFKSKISFFQKAKIIKQCRIKPIQIHSPPPQQLYHSQLSHQHSILTQSDAQIIVPNVVRSRVSLAQIWIGWKMLVRQTKLQKLYLIQYQSLPVFSRRSSQN